MNQRTSLKHLTLLLIIGIGCDSPSIPGPADAASPQDAPATDPQSPHIDGAPLSDASLSDAALSDAALSDAALSDAAPGDARSDSSTPTELKAFPSAYGGGSDSIGGRGGVLVVINTLDPGAELVFDEGTNSYAGGIGAALSSNIGARYIVFNVSGIISLTNDLSTQRDNITIFGQSAPEGGITITGDNMQFTGADHLVVRYLRSRNGSVRGNPISDDQSTYGFRINGGDHVMFDHVSASWGGDKALLMGTNQDHSQNNHTVQRSLLSDSHTYMQMSNQNPANFPVHQDISCLLNLFGRGGNRTPNIGGTDGHIEVMYNVIQSDGHKLGVIQWSDDLYANWSYNYYRMPNDSIQANEFQRQGGAVTRYNPDAIEYHDVRIWTQGNIYENTDGFVLDGSEVGRLANAPIWSYRLNGVPNDTPIDAALIVGEAHSGEIPHPAPMRSAQEAYESVLSDVGANRYLDDNGEVQTFQDSWDLDVIQGVRDNTMERHGYSDDWTLPVIPSGERPASYDTDTDGMADAWEMREFGSLSEDYNGDFDDDGYRNIEEYYNQVD